MSVISELVSFTIHMSIGLIKCGVSAGKQIVRCMAIPVTGLLVDGLSIVPKIIESSTCILGKVVETPLNIIKETIKPIK